MQFYNVSGLNNLAIFISKIVTILYLELDQFIQQLRETCTYKVKANSVKQEHEKQDELKRSALRAVSALSQIPNAGNFILFYPNFLW